MTEQDPEGHRQMLLAAAEVASGGGPRPGSVPWYAVKAELSTLLSTSPAGINLPLAVTERTRTVCPGHLL